MNHQRKAVAAATALQGRAIIAMSEVTAGFRSLFGRAA